MVDDNDSLQLVLNLDFGIRVRPLDGSRLDGLALDKPLYGRFPVRCSVGGSPRSEAFGLVFEGGGPCPCA